MFSQIVLTELGKCEMVASPLELDPFLKMLENGRPILVLQKVPDSFCHALYLEESD